MSAFVGACVGFMWYNSYPAQVFMGDTGSCFGWDYCGCCYSNSKRIIVTNFMRVFLIENLSVVMQVGYFKYTKKKYGEGSGI